MNRIICCVLLLALALTACGGADFDGSRLGNESELTMEFKTLNREDEQNLTIGNQRGEGQSVSGDTERR